MKFLTTSTILLTLGAQLLFAGTSPGKELYAKACRVCHGAEGQGNPAIAKMMKVELRALGSQEVQSQSDDELKKAITDGKGKMKPVTSIKGQQVEDVIAYIRTLKK